jgi:septal ring factor EnvC (AmiA/AmiB activator)
MKARLTRHIFGAAALVALSMIVSGCDYWPPALQAQIEQLQQEAQIATAERTKMIAQLNEENTIKQELQARVEDLTRTNRELIGRISALDQALNAERDKTSRLAKASAKAAPVKTAAKPAPKKTAKKKPAQRTGHSIR